MHACAAFRPVCCALVLPTAAKSRARCQPRAGPIRVDMSTDNERAMSLQQLKGLTGHEARCVGSLLGTLCGDTLGAHHQALVSHLYPSSITLLLNMKEQTNAEARQYIYGALQNRCKYTVNCGSSDSLCQRMPACRCSVIPHTSCPAGVLTRMPRSGDLTGRLRRMCYFLQPQTSLVAVIRCKALVDYQYVRKASGPLQLIHRTGREWHPQLPVSKSHHSSACSSRNWPNDEAISAPLLH